VTGDGQVISGGDDGRLRLWNPLLPGDRGCELGRHQGEVLALAMTGDGRVISGGSDGQVCLWDPAAPNGPGRVLGPVSKLAGFDLEVPACR